MSILGRDTLLKEILSILDKIMVNQNAVSRKNEMKVCFFVLF